MSFRERFLARKQNLRELELPSGEKVLLTDLSFAQQNQLAKALSGENEGNEAEAAMKAGILAVIYTLRDPDGAKVFAEEDLDLLFNQQQDDDMAFLFREAMQQVKNNVERFQDKKKEI